MVAHAGNEAEKVLLVLCVGEEPFGEVEIDLALTAVGELDGAGVPEVIVVESQEEAVDEERERRPEHSLTPNSEEPGTREQKLVGKNNVADDQYIEYEQHMRQYF